MKTVFTLGPASQDKTLIEYFCNIADRFRLNIAHLSLENLENWLSQLDAIFKCDKKLPVILDLQGAKMRIGKYPDREYLPAEVTLFLADTTDNITKIPIPHPDLFKSLQIGDRISLNDARIQLEIIEIKSNSAQAKVIDNGALSSYKGINRTNHPIPFTTLVDRDREAIECGLKYDFVQFACSFVLDGQEAEYLRKWIGDRYLIAKIERPESMLFLDRIDRNFDEFWFCRGDLGSQAGLKALGKLQADFIASFPQLSKPKFIAGQILEYMTHFPQPTRSEVVHLYDIQKAGFDGIVLSDETAVGQYPDRVAEFLQEFLN